MSAKKDHALKLVISDEVFENLQRIKSLLAHTKPNASYAELIEYLVNETLFRLEKKKGIMPAVNSTAAVAVTEKTTLLPTDPLPEGQRVYLPVALRRQVFARSEGRCEYTHDGRRCTSRYALELDHVTPLALGGSNEPSNLRVLCKSHNLQQAAANQVFDSYKIKRGRFHDGGLLDERSH
ncbi:HNH endonuclease signature motif containing protein [Bdellovibrionota bacterium FG-1]